MLHGKILLRCRGRIYAARQCAGNGRLWETRGPGMPGPYRAANRKVIASVNPRAAYMPPLQYCPWMPGYRGTGSGGVKTPPYGPNRKRDLP